VLVFKKGLIRHLAFSCIFKALAWIWFSKVTGPTLPKERCIKVDKVSPEKMRREKTSHNRGPPPFIRYNLNIVQEFTV